jgi:VCBS repeat protein
VSVLLGLGDGTFDEERFFKVSGHPTALSVVDLNRDKKLDIVTANAGSSENNSHSYVSVLLGLGDGTFAAQPPFPVGDNPFVMSVVDVNGDGPLDLVTANSVSKDVSVLLGWDLGEKDNKDKKLFHAEQRVHVGDGPSTLSAVDLDGIRPLDLVTLNKGNSANNFHRYLSVWLGSFSDDKSQKLLFAEQQQFDVGLDPFASSVVDPSPLSVVDVNGDGRLDLVTKNVNSASVSVLSMRLGLGNGKFDEQPLEVAVGVHPTALGVVDVNGDRRLDLVTANRGDEKSFYKGEVSVLLRVPDNTNPKLFAEQQRFDVGGGPFELKVVDLNGDTRLDLVTSNGKTNDVSVLLGRGDGDFRDSSASARGIRNGQTVVADVLGDGRPDALSLNSSRTLLVREGMKDGGFGTFSEVVLPKEKDAPFKLTDKSLTSLRAEGVPEALRLKLNPLKDQEFETRQFLLGELKKILSEDELERFQERILNHAVKETELSEFLVLPPQQNLGAGQAVVVALARSGSELFLGTLDGKGNWTDRGRIPLSFGISPFGKPTPPLVSVLRTGDFNGDGFADLDVLDLLHNRVQLLMQRPNGSFALGATGRVGFAPTDVLVAELNGQPGDDLVVTNRVRGDVGVFVTDAIGGLSLVGRFQATSLLHAVALDETKALQVQTLDRIAAAAVEDFDKDGFPDLIVAADKSLSVSLVKGGPGGTFYDPAGNLAVRLPASATVIRTGYLNGDESLDLVMLLPDIGSVAVVLGNGDGTFGDAVVRSAGFEPKDISLVDANWDGVLDIVVGNDFGDLLILNGSGDGTFQDYVDNLRAQGSVPLALADLDGDGRQEVVLANQAHDRLVVQDIGTRESSLISNSNTPLLAPGAVQLADLNRDQVLELIVANSGGNQVLVYSKQPDGSFGIPQKFAVGTNPTGITIQDVNGDQLPDLVVANRGSNDVSILLNQVVSSSFSQTVGATGSANFTFTPGPRLSTGAGSGPVSTAVRDVNRDGQLDVVVTSADSGTVSYLPGVGNGFFNDVNPATLNIGSTGNQGGIVVGGSFFAANPANNSFTYIRDLDAAFSTGVGIDHFDSHGLSPGYLVVDEFNTDDLFDLFVANAGDGTIAVFSQNGSGFSLSELLSDPNLTHPSALALADIDGVTQILVTDAGEDGITVLDPTMRETTPTTIPTSEEQADSDDSDKGTAILASLVADLSRQLQEDQIQGSEGSDELTDANGDDVPSLGRILERWFRQVSSFLKQELSESLPGSALLTSLLEGDSDTDTVSETSLTQRLWSALKTALDSGQFPLIRLMQQARDVISRLKIPPHVECPESPDRNQINDMPYDNGSAQLDRQQTPQTKLSQQIARQLDAEVQFSVNQVMIELTTVPFVAALVFAGRVSEPVGIRLWNADRHSSAVKRAINQRRLGNPKKTTC